MTEKSTSTSKLASLLAELTGINPATDPNVPNKKKDQHDIVVGTLTPDLRRLWLLRERRRITADDIVSATEDLTVAHQTDHTSLGANMPREKCAEFGRQVDSKMELFTAAYQDFRAVDNIFQAVLGLEFEFPKDKKIRGVREGFEVIARHIDARGDHEDPLDRLHKIETDYATSRLESLLSSLFGEDGPLAGLGMVFGATGFSFRAEVPRREPTTSPTEPAASAS